MCEAHPLCSLLHPLPHRLQTQYLRVSSYRERVREPVYVKVHVCLFQDTKGISAQTLRQLESLLRTQREQTARSFHEFRSLREKLNKEVTSRVKQRWESTAGGSQPEGQPPGKQDRWALRPQERIPFWLWLVCIGGGSFPCPPGDVFLTSRACGILKGK